MSFLDTTGEEAWEARTPILKPGFSGKVEVTDVEVSTSSGNHPQVVLQLAAVDGSGEIRDYLVITPKSYGKWLQRVEAYKLGRVDAFETEGDFKEFCLKFGGKQAYIRVGQREDNEGNPKSEVVSASSEPIGGLSPGGEIPADASGLAASSVGGSDADIPF